MLFDFTAESNAVEKPDLTQTVKRESVCWGFLAFFFPFFSEREMFISAVDLILPSKRAGG